MCRLSANTDTAMSKSMRLLLFDNLMVRSVADADQSYGSGVSDGASVFKSGQSYCAYGFEMVEKLQNTGTWIGHVRMPSKGTEGQNPVASHPFYFPESGLIAAHNGFITGTGESINGEPNVDSYRALKKLSNQLVEQAATIDKHTINNWVSTFGPGSQYAFMLIYKGSLHILRGNRTIAYAEFGNGFIFNTMGSILAGLRQWCSLFSKEFHVGSIREVKENTLVSVINGKMTQESVNKPPAIEEDSMLRYYSVINGEEKLQRIK